MIVLSWRLCGLFLIHCLMVKSERYCYVCSGHRCLQNPQDPDLFPGRVKCHEVMEYCVSHVRYLVKNETYEKGEPLSPEEYTPHSVSRACAKVWLGNTCKRDWLGRPEITCISTCEGDFCNCDSRSPPPQMFKNGKTLAEAPKNSQYSANDLLSCRAMAGVPGYDDYVPIDNDNTPPVRRKIPRRSRKNRRNSAKTLEQSVTTVFSQASFLLLIAFQLYELFPV